MVNRSVIRVWLSKARYVTNDLDGKYIHFSRALSVRVAFLCATCIDPTILEITSLNLFTAELNFLVLLFLFQLGFGRIANILEWHLVSAPHV